MSNNFKSILFLAIIFCGCQNIDVKKDKLYPSDYLFQQRSYPYGKVDHKAYLQTLDQISDYASKSNLFNEDWNSVGPYNISGRVTDIEVDFHDDNILYTGSASGGVLKSYDGGQTWDNIFEGMPTQAIGDISLSASNPDFIAVGTGESNAGGGSIAYDGVGVFASHDGGNNWDHLGLDHVGSIGRILIHPEDDSIIYVGAMGALFKNSSSRGVFKTENGGKSWEHILHISDSTGVIDMAINPQHPDTIYAAAWERIRRPYNRQYGGVTSNIYKSTDGGNNWEVLQGGLPSQGDQKGRIGLAISQSAPNIIYAFYANAIGSIQGIYKSEDHGITWEKKSSDGISNVPYMWWFGRIFVHPMNHNKLYATSLRMYSSDDGSESWQEVFNGAHVDHHAMGFSRLDSNRVWNGNDGGVYFSPDRGEAHVNYEGLNNIQFYACAIDPSNPSRLFGGAQDNGTLMTDGNLDEWRRIFGGDGFRVIVDPDDPNTIYAEAQNGFLARSDNGGNNFNTITSTLFGAFNWNTPIAIDPDSSSVLYTGSQFLFKTEDKGDNWTIISPPLVNPNNPFGNINFGSLTTIDVSSHDNGIIYIGTDDGNVWVTQDGGISYDNISEALPDRWITSVKHDPWVASGVYVTVSGFRFGEMSSQVYYSDDYGVNWIDIGSGLPDIPVNDIQLDLQNSGFIYVATDAGVFVSYDNGNEWELLGNGTEALPITDLDYHLSGILVAASYGKGMMTYNLGDVTSVSSTESNLQISCFPNPAMDYLNIDFDGEWQSIIYDQTGRLHRVPRKGNALEISQIQPGIYYLIIQPKDRKIGSKTLKFVKI